jgi:hypothetical protein
LASILNKQELQLLTQTRDILEEILESVGVAGDKATMKRLREAQCDVMVGRVRPYKGFVKEPLRRLARTRGL